MGIGSQRKLKYSIPMLYSSLVALAIISRLGGDSERRVSAASVIGMHVVVRLFAGMRERVGKPSINLDLPAGASVADAVTAVAREAKAREANANWCEYAHLMTAINDEYVSMDKKLCDGDELALIPPVSGGQCEVPGGVAFSESVEITSKRLDPSQVTARVHNDGNGAVVTFLGVTRDHNLDRRVKYLEYEAYQPMADNMIACLIVEMKQRWDIGLVAVAHRIGRVDVGEPSMVVAVSAEHRRPAFEAITHFVDRLKQVVPIWKKEYFDGGNVWIGRQPDR